MFCIYTCDQDWMLQQMEWFNVTMKLTWLTHGSDMHVGVGRRRVVSIPAHPSVKHQRHQTHGCDNILGTDDQQFSCEAEWRVFWPLVLCSPMAWVVTSFTSSFSSSLCVWRVYGTNSWYLIRPSLTRVQHSPAPMLLCYTQPWSSLLTTTFDPFWVRRKPVKGLR